MSRSFKRSPVRSESKERKSERKTHGRSVRHRVNRDIRLGYSDDELRGVFSHRSPRTQGYLTH